jgi:hypothetical protein
VRPIGQQRLRSSDESMTQRQQASDLPRNADDAKLRLDLSSHWPVAERGMVRKCCSFIPVGRTGAKRTTVPGRFQKARSMRRRIRNRPPAASSPKNRVRRPRSAFCGPWERSAGAAANALSPSAGKPISNGVAGQQFLQDRVAARERCSLSGGRSRCVVRPGHRRSKIPWRRPSCSIRAYPVNAQTFQM